MTDTEPLPLRIAFVAASQEASPWSYLPLCTVCRLTPPSLEIERAVPRRVVRVLAFFRPILDFSWVLITPLDRQYSEIPSNRIEFHQ